MVDSTPGSAIPFRLRHRYLLNAADPFAPGPTFCQAPDSTSLLEIDMSEVAYESRVEVRRLGGPTRSAILPAESEPVLFGVHGAIAEHYGVDMTKIEPHATTIDYVVAAAGG